MISTFAPSAIKNPSVYQAIRCNILSIIMLPISISNSGYVLERMSIFIRFWQPDTLRRLLSAIMEKSQSQKDLQTEPMIVPICSTQIIVPYIISSHTVVYIQRSIFGKHPHSSPAMGMSKINTEEFIEGDTPTFVISAKEEVLNVTLENTFISRLVRN